MINYNGRKFRSITNTENGEVGGDTEFQYRQSGNIVTGIYHGGGVLLGHLLATCNAEGELDMRYHHVNESGLLMTGTCRTRPELLSDGRLRLHEHWQWTSGDGSSGTSILEEVRS
jgi:hypothetical protein